MEVDFEVSFFLMTFSHLCSVILFCQEIAELYESEQNIDRAIVFFEKAADMFLNEEVTTSANQCKQKVAQYAAELEQ